MAAIFIGKRFQQFATTGSMGVVNDVTYWRCYWPNLDQPTALFADGSSGIKVMGTARNVIFPDDTVFLDFYPDALYPAEQAVHAAFPNKRLGMIELTQEMADVYMRAYDEAVASFPETHAVHLTRGDCHFLAHDELVSSEGAKPVNERYVSEVDLATAKSIASGQADVEALKTAAEFVALGSDPLDPSTQKFTVTDGAMVEVSVKGIKP